MTSETQLSSSPFRVSDVNNLGSDPFLFSAGCEQTLSLFNITSDSVDRFLDLHHDDSVLSACLSSDSRRLASGAADQLIRVRPESLIQQTRYIFSSVQMMFL